MAATQPVRCLEDYPGLPPVRISACTGESELHGSPAQLELMEGSMMNLNSISRTIKSFARIDIDNRSDWEELVKKAVGRAYLMVKNVVLGQMRLLILAHVDLYPIIEDVRIATQATGVGGVGQNKGGMAVSLKVWDTHLCFVNSHLAAHQDKQKSRNAMYRSLLRGLKVDEHGMDLLTAFHHVFWMGDLNYRIEFSQSCTPSEAEFASVVSLCREGHFKPLLEKDQLKLQISDKAAFHGFLEGDIDFKPTFKVERENGCQYNPKRLPAWCDRVLWKSALPSRKAEVLDYYSVPEVASSDHKPVAAFFHVPTIFYNYGVENETDAMIVLAIKRLRAENLFMIKHKTVKDPKPPNPQVQVALRGRRLYNTAVVYRQRDPVWKSSIRMKIKESELTRLAQYRLLFRVVSRNGGLSGTAQTIGRGLLPLDAVRVHAGSKKFFFSFNVQLEYNSIEAGTLIGDIKISLKKRRTRREDSFTLG